MCTHVWSSLNRFISETISPIIHRSSWAHVHSLETSSMHVRQQENVQFISENKAWNCTRFWCRVLVMQKAQTLTTRSKENKTKQKKQFTKECLNVLEAKRGNKDGHIRWSFERYFNSTFQNPLLKQMPKLKASRPIKREVKNCWIHGASLSHQKWTLKKILLFFGPNTLGQGTGVRYKGAYTPCECVYSFVNSGTPYNPWENIWTSGAFATMLWFRHLRSISILNCPWGRQQSRSVVLAVFGVSEVTCGDVKMTNPLCKLCLQSLPDNWFTDEVNWIWSRCHASSVFLIQCLKKDTKQNKASCSSVLLSPAASLNWE